MIALFMGKGAANQAVPRFREDMHSRASHVPVKTGRESRGAAETVRVR